MLYRPALIAISLLLFCVPALAEEKWVSIQLERTPIVDRLGTVVDRPIFYAKDKKRLTKGGDWVIPQELRIRAIERYQREGELLMLVDVPPQMKLPGKLQAKAEAEKIKWDVFRVKPIEAETGVTK